MTVFILGAGVMQIPAIRIAKELGWRVAAADGNPAAPGAALADLFFPVDLKDREGLLAAAKGLARDGGLEAVFTAGTDFSASVAYVAGSLGLPGHSLEAARRASDKPLMRAALAAAGVPSPRFAEFRSARDLPAALKAASLSFPLVVKPADSMGARGCRLVTSLPELEAALADALPHSRTGRAIVEEYLDGPEFSIDALVQDGRVAVRGLADRHVFFAPYFVELGHTMPCAYPKEVLDEVLRVFEEGVRALGLTRGAAKGDIKYCPGRGRAYVGEIAARLSGGYMSGWTYPYASGIEVTRGALELAAGLEPSGGAADRGWVSAERAFIAIPGRAAAVLGLREAEAAPYVKNLFLRVAPGEACVFPSNNVEKCGNVISQAPSREAAVSAAEGAVRGILVRLRPGEAATEAFLRGEGRIANPDGGVWPPEAFSPGPRLAAFLAALPESPRAAEAGGIQGAGAEGQAAPPVLLVAPLPDEFHEEAASLGPDWSGRGFLESAELALSLGGARLAPEGAPALAGRFWRALARGGAQAALYVLDTEARGGEGA